MNRGIKPGQSHG